MKKNLMSPQVYFNFTFWSMPKQMSLELCHYYCRGFLLNFRFSVRYDKGGSEKKFGMFGYGHLAEEFHTVRRADSGWRCGPKRENRTVKKS